MKYVKDEYGEYLECEIEDLLHGYCNNFAQAYYDSKKDKYPNIRIEQLQSKNSNYSFMHEYCVVNDRYYVDVRGVFDSKEKDITEFYHEFLEYDHVEIQDTVIRRGYGNKYEPFEDEEQDAAYSYANTYISENEVLFSIQEFEKRTSYDKLCDLKEKADKSEKIVEEKLSFFI